MADPLPYVPGKRIFTPTLNFFLMSTKTNSAENTQAVTAERVETAQEALHRRVKQNQVRRRLKLKHVNP
ncbi:hypothetical protein GCM10022408_31900 [Hymenobacter fastidiosus]|uniref:Uncharacterized protein n=1 Tax=Hymenobacter fastidiosus TaxID=486264 RepID=A0ABP7SST0_9BACT